MTIRKFKLPTSGRRELAIENPAVDADARTVTFSFASDEPVFMGGYGVYEILDHTNPDFSRLNNGAPILFNHKCDVQIGVVEKAWVEDGRSYCTARYADDAEADKFFRRIQSGIMRNVSVGYSAGDWEFMGRAPDEREIFRAKSWVPFEVSNVTIPADPSVGVGRSIRALVKGEDTVELEFDVGEKTVDVEAQRATEEGQAAASDAPQDEKPVINKSAETDVEQRSAGGDVDDVAIHDMSDKDVAPTNIQVRENKQVTDKVKDGKDTRAEEIFAIADEAGVPQNAVRDAIASGMSVDNFLRVALRHTAATREQSDISKVDLSTKERKSVNILRGLYAQRRGETTLETEISDEIKQRAAALGLTTDDGLHLADFAQGRRTITTGTSAGLIATNLQSEVLDAALDIPTFVEKLGVTRVQDLSGLVAFPRQNGAVQFYFAAEGEAITKSGPGFTSVAMSPNRVGALIEITEDMLKQSDQSVDALVRRDMMIRNAALDEHLILNGPAATGSTKGILTASNITGITPGAADLDAILEAEEELLKSYMLSDTFGVLAGRNVRRVMRGRPEFDGAAVTLWQGSGHDGRVADYAAFATNGLATSQFILGAWRQFILADWGVASVKFDENFKFAQGIGALKMTRHVDVLNRAPKAFVKATVTPVTPPENGDGEGGEGGEL